MKDVLISLIFASAISVFFLESDVKRQQAQIDSLMTREGRIDTVIVYVEKEPALIDSLSSEEVSEIEGEEK